MDPESEEGQPHSASRHGSRMNIHVNRMNSMVERLARERDGPWQPSSTLGLFTDVADSASSHMNASLHTKQGHAPVSGSSLSETPGPRSSMAGSEPCGKPSSMIPGEDHARKTSPLLTQLFNNEMVCAALFVSAALQAINSFLLTRFPTAHSKTRISCHPYGESPGLDLF